MKKNLIKLLAIAALLLPGASSLASEPDVAVYNNTRLPDLGKFLTEVLPAQLKEELKARNLAIYAQAASFDSLHLCHAKVGITELPGPQRNARHPSFWSFAAHTMDAASWESGKCEGTVLGRAIAALQKEPMDVLFKSAHVVRNAGGQRLAEKQDATMVRIHQTGGIGDRLDPLFAMLHERSMGELFDHRAVQTVIETNTADLQDGRKMCLAQVGLSARSNEGRNPRMPAYITRFAKIVEGGDPDECKVEAAKVALKGFLELPYEKMLLDFSLTREEGRAQPELAKVKATSKRLAGKAAASAAAGARQASKNTVSCSNQCRNGDCVRTFANGRKEHWTAPRVFDPITRDWKWDITTNACGV